MRKMTLFERSLMQAGATEEEILWAKINPVSVVELIKKQRAITAGVRRGVFRVDILSDAEISFRGRIDAGGYDQVLPEELYRTHHQNKGGVWVLEGYSVDIEFISGLSMQARFGSLGYFSGEDAREQLAARGYRSVTTPEFLALGAAHREEQKKYLITSAEGSILYGHEPESRYGGDRKAYLSLNYRKTDRILSLDKCIGWDRETRFAVVKLNSR